MNLEKLSIIMEANNNMSIELIIMNLLTTFLIMVIIFLIYKMTFSGVAYSHNFNVSIVLTGMITAVIMMVIGNNLALSLGMVGALSIVRFRAAIKEPKDISYIFWAIAVGLSAGTGAIKIAVVGSIAIAITVLVFQLKLFNTQTAYLLVIRGAAFDETKIIEYVKKHTKRHKLRMKNTSRDNKEIIFEVRIHKNYDSRLMDGLYQVDGIEQVNIVSYDGHLNE